LHIEAQPYADQLDTHADLIESLVAQEEWERDTPVCLEISLVYSCVVIRKLWEHYESLFRERGFDLNDTMAGLEMRGGDGRTSGLTFVHRVIHSQRIETGEQSKVSGVQFESDHKGSFEIGYREIIAFLRCAAAATRAIHG